MEKEIWKDIEGFPGYQASNTGFIRGLRDYHGNITNTPKVLKTRINKDGYYELTLYTQERRKVTKRVHRVIAETFFGKHPGLVVNHINGDKLDNRVENLEFVTAEQNSTLASKCGLYKTKPIKIRETNEVFRSIKECADAIEASPSNISAAIANNKKRVRDLSFELLDQKEYESLKSKHKRILYDYQYDAVDRMFNGCILNGGVGSGKSRTGLYYYFKEQGGSFKDEFIPMKNPKDLYIITTAKKRDSLEFEGELAYFRMSTDPKLNLYDNKIIIDSWNNIQKYADVHGAFFIFDEDRVTGKGAWAKTFIKIAKSNDWVILSATSGDTWEDYIPVFIANGFYKNRTEFAREHIIYSRFTKYPKIDRYINTGRLIRLRDKILIDMDFNRHTIPINEDVYVSYNISKYKDVMRTRWDPYKDKPIEQASGLCYVLRRIVNEDESRQVALLQIFEEHPKMIVFYSFDYELDILKSLYYGDNVEIAEWNGHAHQEIPRSNKWVYLVNYNAGAEGWNCILTDTIVFYSQNYSYKTLEQARGRIDRLNSPFIYLHYYHLKSRSGIDLAISRALSQKKDFNETRYVNRKEKKNG